MGEVVCHKVLKAFNEVKREEIERSHAGMLLVLLRASGIQTDYSTIMVSSGWAGRFIYHPREKSWISFVPHKGAVERALAPFGMRFQMQVPKSADEAYQEIKSATDSCKGVMADYYETLVFCGYDEGATRRVFWLCSPFSMEGTWWDWEEFQKQWWEAGWPKWMLHLTESKRPQGKLDATREAIEQIVEFSRESPFEGMDGFEGALSGFDGLRAYAADIADISKTMQSSDTPGEHYFDRGWGCYAVYPQWTARRSTAEYLKSVAPKFTGRTQKHLESAAKQYDEVVEAWEKWECNLGRSREFADLPEAERNLAYDGNWADPDKRFAGYTAVLEAVDHEREAITELEAALSAWPGMTK